MSYLVNDARRRRVRFLEEEFVKEISTSAPRLARSRSRIVKNVYVGTTVSVSTLGDLAVMRRRAAKGELQPAEVEMLFAELQRLRATEEALESRRCKLHHILGALAAHFSARAAANGSRSII